MLVAWSERKRKGQQAGTKVNEGKEGQRKRAEIKARNADKKAELGDNELRITRPLSGGGRSNHNNNNNKLLAG